MIYIFPYIKNTHIHIQTTKYILNQNKAYLYLVCYQIGKLENLSIKYIGIDEKYSDEFSSKKIHIYSLV